MRNIPCLLFVSLVTISVIKTDDSKLRDVPGELFCTDEAALFYISADKHVTYPTTKTRLIVLLLEEEGKLLLDMEQQLVYPVIPSVTPVYLYGEANLIILPDLEKEGAFVGLMVLEGLDILIYELVHQLPPPGTGLMSRVDKLSDKLDRKAEAAKGVAPLQKEDPDEKGWPWWRSGTHMAVKTSEKFVEVSSSVHKLAGQVIYKLRQAVKPGRPASNKRTEEKGLSLEEAPVGPTEGDGPVDPTAETNVNKPADHLGIKVSNNMARVTEKAFGKVAKDNMATATLRAFGSIAGVIGKTKDIVVNKLAVNTVRIMNDNFGENMGGAVGDVIKTMKNMAAAVEHLADFKIENLAMRGINQMAGLEIPESPSGKPPPGMCKDL